MPDKGDNDVVQDCMTQAMAAAAMASTGGDPFDADTTSDSFPMIWKLQDVLNGQVGTVRRASLPDHTRHAAARFTAQVLALRRL